MYVMKLAFFVSVVCIFSVHTDGRGTEADVSSVALNSTDDSSSSEEVLRSYNWRPDKELNFTSYRKLSGNESDGVVSLELRDVGSADHRRVHARIPSVIVNILNRPGTRPSASAINTNKTEVDTPAHATDNSSTDSVRTRRSDGSKQTSDQYAAKDVSLIMVHPDVDDGKLRAAFFVKNKEGKVLEAEQLKDKLEKNKDELSSGLGYTVESIYVGMPKPPRPYTVWDMHRGLFMGVLILIGVAILILILCCLCFICCRQRKSTQGSSCKKEPNKKPYCEEEMVELAPVIPLQSAPPQQHQPNGDGKPNSDDVPASTDDEKGWIVPLDQLSPEELDKPADVPVSKL